MELSDINILDTETTGLDHQVDRLVELALLNAQEDNYFSSLCDPGRPIPPEASAIHHITDFDVIGFPDPARVLTKAVTQMAEPKVLVAHNAKFDRGFIEDLTQRAWDPHWVCTYKCSVMTWPDAPSHGNQVLRYWLGLDLPMLLDFPHLMPHRALYDIICTRGIFLTLLKLHPLKTLIEWSNKPILLPKVSFGKHKGKLWSEVDRGYLSWCLREKDMNEDVQHTARYWMDKRS